MIILIDNNDSSVHSISRYIGQLGRTRAVITHKDITDQYLASAHPEAIILAPGAFTRANLHVCNSVIERFYTSVPILATGPGYQSFISLFGGRTKLYFDRAFSPQVEIIHRGDGVFLGLPNPLQVGQYRSIRTEIQGEDGPLQVIARAKKDRRIMGVRHKDFPVYGLPFNPGSALTSYGIDIIRNFMIVSDQWQEEMAAA